jgi:hypothetical protein
MSPGRYCIRSLEPGPDRCRELAGGAGREAPRPGSLAPAAEPCPPTLNPLATYQKRFTLERIMNDVMIAYPNTPADVLGQLHGAATESLLVITVN